MLVLCTMRGVFLSYSPHRRLVSVCVFGDTKTVCLSSNKYTHRTVNTDSRTLCMHYSELNTHAQHPRCVPRSLSLHPFSYQFNTMTRTTKASSLVIVVDHSVCQQQRQSLTIASVHCVRRYRFSRPKSVCLSLFQCARPCSAGSARAPSV